MLVRLHLAQLELASQVSQVWLILSTELIELIENPKGQTLHELSLLQEVSATQSPLLIVYPSKQVMQLRGLLGEQDAQGSEQISWHPNY